MTSTFLQDLKKDKDIQLEQLQKDIILYTTSILNKYKIPENFRYDNNPNNDLPDEFPQIFEDMVPHIAACLRTLLRDRKTNSHRFVDDAVEQYLEFAISNLQTGPSDMKGFYYRTSLSATDLACPVIDKLRSFLDQYKHIVAYYSDALALVQKNQRRLSHTQAFLLNIKHHYIQDQHIDFYEMIHPLKDEDLPLFQQAFADNKKIESISFFFDNPKSIEWLEAIASFSSLKKIYLGHHQSITSDIFQGFITKCQIPDLKLSGHYCINENIAHAIAKNNHIQSLSIWAQSITEETLAIILQSPTLSSIELKDIKITDTLIEMLMKNQNLKQISLIFDKPHEQLKQLANKSSLETLKLNCDKITDADSHVFVNAHHFTKLEIASNSITEKFSAPLSGNSNLAELRLYGERIKTPGPQYFATTAEHPNKKQFKTYLLSLEQSPAYISPFLNQLQHDAVVELVLDDVELQQKLNTVNLDKNKQSFLNSCTAKSLLTLLEKCGLLPPEENTVTTELKIYKEIWSKFNEPANIKRLVDYVNQLAQQGFDMCLYENPDLLQQYGVFLQQYENHAQLHLQYNNYLDWAKSDTSCKKQQDKIAKLHHPENFQLLFITASNSKLKIMAGTHCTMLYQEQGHYFLYEPGQGSYLKSKSMDDLITQLAAKNWELTGIALEVSLKPTLSVQYKNKMSHFLFKPESKSLEEETISNVNVNVNAPSLND